MKLTPHNVTCSYCGRTWTDSHPDLPGASVWCGECNRTPKSGPDHSGMTNAEAAAMRSAAHQLRMLIAGTGGDAAKALKLLEQIDDNREIGPNQAAVSCAWCSLICTDAQEAGLLSIAPWCGNCDRVTIGLAAIQSRETLEAEVDRLQDVIASQGRRLEELEPEPDDEPLSEYLQ